MEDCLLWEGPHTGTREECEEEGAAETTWDELTAIPVLRPPCAVPKEEKVEKNRKQS